MKTIKAPQARPETVKTVKVPVKPVKKPARPVKVSVKAGKGLVKPVKVPVKPAKQLVEPVKTPASAAKKPVKRPNRGPGPVKAAKTGKTSQPVVSRKPAVKPALQTTAKPVKPAKKPVEQVKPAKPVKPVKPGKRALSIAPQQNIIPKQKNKPAFSPPSVEKAGARPPEARLPVRAGESNARQPDRWSDCGQVFYTAGQAFGIADNLRTVYLGTRPMVQDFLDSGRLDEGLHKFQKSTLLRIREENRSKREGCSDLSIKPEPAKPVPRRGRKGGNHRPIPTLVKTGTRRKGPDNAPDRERDKKHRNQDAANEKHTPVRQKRKILSGQLCGKKL